MTHDKQHRPLEIANELDNAHEDRDWQERPAPVGITPGKVSRTFGLPARPVHIWRAATGAAALTADSVAALEEARNSAGSPLGVQLQSELEAALGQSLGGVRVHTGPASQRAAEAIHARAYADGTDIHFGAGQYGPESPAGRRLVAHEVAHTVQSAERAALGLVDSLSSPGDQCEVAADRFADDFASGGPTRATPQVGAGAPGIRRDLADDAENVAGHLGNSYTVAVTRKVGAVSLGGSISFSRADKESIGGRKSKVALKSSADKMALSISQVVASAKGSAKIAGLTVSVSGDLLEVGLDPRDAKLGKIEVSIRGDGADLAAQLGLEQLEGLAIKVKLAASVSIGPETIARLARAKKARDAVKRSADVSQRQGDELWKARKARVSHYRKMKTWRKRLEGGGQNARYYYKHHRLEMRRAAKNVKRLKGELQRSKKAMAKAVEAFNKAKGKLKNKWAKVAGSKMGKMVGKFASRANVVLTVAGLAVDLYYIVKAIDGDAIALDWNGGGIGDSDAGASETGDGGGVEGGTEEPGGSSGEAGGGRGGETPEGTSDVDLGADEEAEIEGVGREGGVDAENENEPSADRNGDGAGPDGDGGEAIEVGPDLSLLHPNARAVIDAIIIRDDDGPAIDELSLALVNDFVPEDLTEAQLEKLVAALKARKADEATDIDIALGVIAQEVNRLFAGERQSRAENGTREATKTPDADGAKTDADTARPPPAPPEPSADDFANLWAPTVHDAAALTKWMPEEGRLVKSPDLKQILAERAPLLEVANGTATVVDVHLSFDPTNIGVDRPRYAYTLQLDVVVGNDDDSMLYESPEYQFFIEPEHEGSEEIHLKRATGVFDAALRPLIELDDSGNLVLVGGMEFEIAGVFRATIGDFVDMASMREEVRGQGTVHFVRLRFLPTHVYREVSLINLSDERQTIVENVWVETIIPLRWE